VETLLLITDCRVVFAQGPNLESQQPLRNQGIPPASTLPPFEGKCTAREFLESVALGSRNGVRDGPFYSSCEPHHYTSSEACGVLASFDSILVFGESHERHLVQGKVVGLQGFRVLGF
jgi:hypothetical protein